MARMHIVYEQPLSERIRTFLRLEFLFNEAHYRTTGETPWDSRAAVARLLEILTLLSRGDLRQEAIKELERHSAQLVRLRNSPDVEAGRLQVLLDELQANVRALHGNGAAVQSLRENEFLNAIRQRSAIPGGTCEFDLPAYHYWLSRPAAERTADIRRMLVSLDPLRDGLSTILRLIRDSSAPVDEVARGGTFQETLDRNTPCHMVRVILPADTTHFPEISGSKHRFTIRFLELPELGRRPAPTRADVPFRLISCIF